MKVVILAGGLGTRFSEETTLRPKPMVEIGGRPILWHIMKIYSHYGFNEFVICLGFKGYMIKEYFSNYFLHMSDVTFDVMNNTMLIHERHVEPWKVTLIDTGADTMTGGRMKRIARHIGDETFMMTYGDGVSDVNVNKLVEYHKNHGKMATVTAIRPAGRYGALKLTESEQVVSFQEKVDSNGSWVNGGFFVLDPRVIKLIPGDTTIWERAPMEELAGTGQLMAFKHGGFWSAMDTLSEKIYLEEMWQQGKAPWKLWASP